MKLLTSGLAFAAVVAANQALAWEATAGKPHEGETVHVLAVKSSQFEAQEARLEAFESATGIDVVVDYVPFPNMKEALTTEMVAGGDYDVVSIMDQWVPSLRNLVQPIGEEIGAQGTDLDDFPAAHLRHGMLDGELVGLPVRGHVQLLFYRSDLLDQAGVEVPTTWDEVVAASKAIQEKTDAAAGIALPYGKLNGQNLMVWINLLWGNGGDLFDENGEPVFNSEAGIKATEQYIGFLTEDKIAPAGSAAFVEQDAVNSFKQGNSAMLPVWWWVRSQLTDPEQSTVAADQLGFTALPSVGDASRTTYTNTWIFSVTEGADNKDAAAEYLGWLTDPALERDILLDEDLNEVVAVHFSNLRDAEVNERWGGMHAAAADALATAEGMEFGDDWPRISEILETAVSSLASGEESDTATALNHAAEEIKRIR